MNHVYIIELLRKFYIDKEADLVFIWNEGLIYECNMDDVKIFQTTGMGYHWMTKRYAIRVKGVAALIA